MVDVSIYRFFTGMDECLAMDGGGCIAEVWLLICVVSGWPRMVSWLVAIDLCLALFYAVENVTTEVKHKSIIQYLVLGVPHPTILHKPWIGP